jgi:hypothetical protein
LLPKELLQRFTSVRFTFPTNTTHSIVKQRGHCAPPRRAAPGHTYENRE